MWVLGIKRLTFPKKSCNSFRVSDSHAIFHEPFEYLTELQRHSAGVAARPSECMPWNRPCWRGCTIKLHL